MNAVLSPLRIDEKTLLENHLEFLRTHRGSVSRSDDTWIVKSEKEEFTFPIPSENSLLLPLMVKFKTIYLTPSCLRFERRLEANGFSHDGGLNYMNIKTLACNWRINEQVSVKQASDENDFEEFSFVQSKGFCDTDEEFAAWHPWLRSANFSNMENASQVFYVASIGQKPVGVALAVYHRQMAGIYAVTTLPEFRKQGVSSTIMKQIATDALMKGIDDLALQVVHGSYAEFFYQRLGFKSAFLMKIMSKA